MKLSSCVYRVATADFSLRSVCCRSSSAHCFLLFDPSVTFSFGIRSSGVFEMWDPIGRKERWFRYEQLRQLTFLQKHWHQISVKDSENKWPSEIHCMKRWVWKYKCSCILCVWDSQTILSAEPLWANIFSWS